MGEHRELLLGLFDESAQRAISTARELSGGLIDSQCLLAALTRDESLWDAAYLERVRVGEVNRLVTRTERAGEAMTGGVKLSREAETLLTEALEKAHADRRSQASAADLLWALGGSGGSDATHWLRATTGEPDPWRPVMLHLIMLGQRAEPQTPSGERPRADDGNYLLDDHAIRSLKGRMVALVYVLLRDEVLPGKFAKIVRELNGVGDISQVKFSSRELQALAASYVDDLWR